MAYPFYETSHASTTTDRPRCFRGHRGARARIRRGFPCVAAMKFPNPVFACELPACNVSAVDVLPKASSFTGAVWVILRPHGLPPCNSTIFSLPSNTQSCTLLYTVDGSPVTLFSSAYSAPIQLVSGVWRVSAAFLLPDGIKVGDTVVQNYTVAPTGASSVVFAWFGVAFLRILARPFVRTVLYWHPSLFQVAGSCLHSQYLQIPTRP